MRPLIFTSGLFSFFTSDSAPITLPGAPFLLGAVLMGAAVIVVFRLFRRMPAPSQNKGEVAAEGVD